MSMPLNPRVAGPQSLLASFTQDTRLLQMTTPLGADLLLAECVHGTEGISQGYRFEISALSTDAAIRLKSLIGQPVLLELLTAEDRHARRPFHGHVTSVVSNGANGGFARYTLVLEPWTAFLALGRDSRVFQDMCVFDILEAVFAPYQGKGVLAPAWRFEIRDRGVYPRRSLTTQYQESDRAFAERLMHEEGLFYFFEHDGDPGSPTLGSHTMVIADHNGSFAPGRQPSVRFTRPGAAMREDSMDRWRTETRLQTNAVDNISWDYRIGRARMASAASQGSRDPHPRLTSRDAPGVYAWETSEQARRSADKQLQGIEIRRKVHIGAGTVRELASGTIFTLHGEATLDRAGEEDRRLLVVRVAHEMNNNLHADLRDAVLQQLGPALADTPGGPLHAPVRPAPGAGIAERPLYRNRIEAVRSDTPFRSSGVDQHGRFLHPRPTVKGQQTAIVVGPAGSVVHTDRDHRIKVQFHWQRGVGSHSRLPHPAPDGHTGAPADDTAGTWVRVATPLAPIAGENWGSHAIPRVGQEVLVDFLEGDIDRPVVIACLYNGKGQADAQYNGCAQGAGSATGNAPAWFPGEAAGHGHAAVLSGIKSQAMQASQDGAGAYGQLVFDDTPGEARIGLQQHAQPHQGTSELNLGHLRHQTDNQRLQPVGFGAELKTVHAAALRAGRGLLLSTDMRGGASGDQLDSREALAQVTESLQLQTSLAETAQKHNAALKDEQGNAEAEAGKLPALAAMARSAETLAADDTQAGSAPVTAYDQAMLQLSSPAGIVVTTPANAVLSAGDSSCLTAGQDINLVAQGSFHQAVRHGISLFTYGKATNKGKPNQETGIKLHAASGKLSSQSQTGPTHITADKTITVASVEKSVTVAAKQHVLLTAQGACIKLEGGDIMLHAPGKVEFKASKKELAGPASSKPTLPFMPDPADIENFLELNYRWDDMQPMVGAPYKVTFDNGTSIEGKLDAKGFARIENIPSRMASVVYGEDERDAVPRHEREPNEVAGARPRNDEEAAAVLEKYLAQEAAYYKDNYFPDELEAMESGGEDYAFHYDDYRYADEDTPEVVAAERSYRERHDHESGSGSDSGDEEGEPA